MTRPTNYNTKQREAILAYIVSLNREHISATQIVEHFEKKDVSISRTTVYRLLNKLTNDGIIRKYTIDGVSGACFQYADKEKACREHFHLKCEDCGELLHLQCEELDEVSRHVFNEHYFKVNTMKTVLYGKCNNCL